jgi:rhodanese-related sulfurtransferase
METLRIEPRDAYALVASGEPVIFVDTRNPKAWAASDEKVPHAIRIPLDELEARLYELDRGATIISYCT